MTKCSWLMLGILCLTLASVARATAETEPLPPDAQTRIVIVAVVDSGVDQAHPALRERLMVGYNFGDCRDREACTPGTLRNPQDRLGHGTAVAGLLSAAQGEYLKILPIKINSGMQDDFSPAAVVAALDQARASGARVVNMSLEMPDLTAEEKLQVGRAIDRAQNAGLVIVVPAGNRSARHPFPADHPGVVVAGGLDEGGRIHGSDARDAQHLLFAHAYLHAGLELGGASGARKMGTSFAAPRVSGALAAILAENLCLTSDAAIDLLMSTADHVPDGRLVRRVLNVSRAVELAKQASTRGACTGVHHRQP